VHEEYAVPVASGHESDGANKRTVWVAGQQPATHSLRQAALCNMEKKGSKIAPLGPDELEVHDLKTSIYLLDDYITSQHITFLDEERPPVIAGIVEYTPVEKCSR
jgi:hypothetical protein